MQGQPWRQYANCNGMDPNLFYPERGGDFRTPKAVCRGCVVQEECLDHAMSEKEQHGVWGNLSERERRLLRRRRGNPRANHGTASRANSGCTCEQCSAKLQALAVVAS